MRVQAGVLEESYCGQQVRIAQVFAGIPECGRRRPHAPQVVGGWSLTGIITNGPASVS
jgi:thioesterase domain-containing protein